MGQLQAALRIETKGQGLYEITGEVLAWLADQPLSDGLLTVFCRHTSASLTIQENADPSVLADLNDFFSRLVARNPALYRHGAEGPDDMPAHIRSVLTDCSLTIPVAGKRPLLGTWQGIFLFEHRDRPHSREVILQLLG